MFNKFWTMLTAEGDTDKDSAYICEGGCGAHLSEKEYQDDPTKTCGTEGCANKGKPFMRKEHKDEGHCEHCGDTCQHCSA